MLNNQLNLYHYPIEQLLSFVKKYYSFQYDYKKHCIEILDKQNEVDAYIRLPLHYKIDDTLGLLNDETVVVYLTIEAGNAAVSLRYGEEELYHKTFSAYMTRKKQGMSQIKYLNKKGKSRAGSRVRLASTLEFFETINTKLNELFIKYSVDRVAFSCTPTLLPYLYDSKIETPFDKKDSRLYKIPLHLPQSNYTNLVGVIKKLKAPVLFYREGFDCVPLKKTLL